MDLYIKVLALTVPYQTRHSSPLISHFIVLFSSSYSSVVVYSNDYYSHYYYQQQQWFLLSVTVCCCCCCCCCCCNHELQFTVCFLLFCFVHAVVPVGTFFSPFFFSFLKWEIQLSLRKASRKRLALPSPAGHLTAMRVLQSFTVTFFPAAAAVWCFVVFLLLCFVSLYFLRAYSWKCWNSATLVLSHPYNTLFLLLFLILFSLSSTFFIGMQYSLKT